VYIEMQTRLVEHLRRLREAKGWTQTEAATRLGMKVQQFQQIEAGTNNATMVTLARVAEGFGVDIVELFAPVQKRQRS
jgi:transcriptional regulator with XRE-family HTH domain